MDAATLREYLRRERISGTVMEFDHPVRTVKAASVMSGVPPTRIVKSLVLMDGAGHAYICLVPGDRRLDLSSAERELGVGRLRLADEKEVLRETGYEAGAVPPIAHTKRLKVLMDRKIQGMRTIVAGGGSSQALIEISPSEVMKVTKAQIADISA